MFLSKKDFPKGKEGFKNPIPIVSKFIFVSFGN
jgi:hypothetical protein